MSVVKEFEQALKKAGTKERAKASLWYFKTGKGEYGEGDLFYGVTVPVQRKIAKHFYLDLTLFDLSRTLQSKYHEVRFTSLEALVMKFDRAVKLQDDKTQKAIYDLYLKSTKYINNWDLVDTSAQYIVGPYLQNRSRAVLKKLAKSKSLWERRIAIISCFHFIGQKDFKDALQISVMLLKDNHDLIHKAVGWMLREIGNRDLKTELVFLDKHTLQMPRTMLRYAIEKFPEKLRLKYLKMK